MNYKTHKIPEMGYRDNNAFRTLVNLKAPFPYFGGKSMVANIVWQALGQPDHYIEPFVGSAAVLLKRPEYNPLQHTETICDKDGFISNVWRSLQFSPNETAKWCDWPVNHADLIARKARLIRKENYLLENLCKDDKWCDIELAGYWIWAASCWIANGLRSPNQIPNLSNTGTGIHAKSQRFHIDNVKMEYQDPYNINIYKWFRQLSERLRYVRIFCGDWSRVCGGDWQDKGCKTVGMFFDPPYSITSRDMNIYHKDSITVAKDVREWILERGKRESYRIVYAGYDEEGIELETAGWDVYRWKTGQGYSNTSRSHTRGKNNSKRECLWFSPYCNKREKQMKLF